MARGRNNNSSNGKQKNEPPKVKISKESLRQALILFTYLKPYRGKFILSLVFIALSAFTTSLFPLFLGKMIDAASPGAALPGMGSDSVGSQFSAGLKNIHWSLNTTLILIFLQLGIQTVFSFMRVYLLTEVGEKSLADMRKDVYSKLLSMPMSFFTEKRVGELSNRISSDLSQIQDAISFTLAEFLRGIFTLIIGLAFIFWISTKLALVMLAVVPVIAVLAVVFGIRIRRMARKAQDQLADSGTIVQETFQGISMVKAFTSEFYEISRYVKSIYAVVSTAISNARYRGAFVSFMIFSVFGAIAFVMWYGAGMSTIASLLLKFYEPNNGRIFFDERSSSEFPLSQLRMQMAFVPQDVILFGGSIKENIAYGKPGAGDDEIMAAAKQANAHEFVERFPERYETIVGELGIKLSSGAGHRTSQAWASFKETANLTFV